MTHPTRVVRTVRCAHHHCLVVARVALGTRALSVVHGGTPVSKLSTRCGLPPRKCVNTVSYTNNCSRAFSALGARAAQGRVMDLPAIWNTVTGRLDPLPDASSRTLTWYSCGPTVYDSAHLGHARTYVCQDIIRRILSDYFRFDVTYAMGITDIDDKIIARARERGLDDSSAMATEYEMEFMSDMAALGVRPPDAVTRVTDHMQDIIAYIERIIENDMAYEAEGGIYFDVEKLGSEYGKLGVGASPSTSPDAAGESDLLGKKSHRDFALWKRSKPQEPWWESPYGPGRPGWHIECSAMTHSLFGPRLDIHSGGIDLKFPHHTNEIAQCDAHRCGPGDALATDEGNGDRSKSWVRHWLHTGHLHIEGLKMSKSLKNFITVQEYLDGHADGREIAAQDFRMFCLMHRYSATVIFSADRMEEASVLRGRFERFFALAQATLSNEGWKRPARRWSDRDRRLAQEVSACRREVRLALSDDFDTARAIRQLASLCTLISKHLNDLDSVDLGPIASAVRYTGATLGLLGLQFHVQDAGESLGANASALDSDTARGLPPAEDVVAAMVDFRRLVRKIVLARSANNMSPGAKHMRRDLLELVDSVRDDVLPDLNIHVRDESIDACTWMVLPARGRVKKNEDIEENRSSGRL